MNLIEVGVAPGEDEGVFPTLVQAAISLQNYAAGAAINLINFVYEAQDTFPVPLGGFDFILDPSVEVFITEVVRPIMKGKAGKGEGSASLFS